MTTRRRWTALLLPAALAALAVSRAGAQALTPEPLRSGEVSFFVQVSNGPDFTGHVAVTKAGFTGADVAAAQGFVEVRLVDMQTGIGLRDRHMRNAMDADSFPTIRFEVTGLTPGTSRGDTIGVTYRGRLTIHGQTRDVTAEGTLVALPGRLDVTATLPVDMREYGVAPPTRFFGTVKVQPVVRITARLRFGAAGAAPKSVRARAALSGAARLPRSAASPRRARPPWPRCARRPCPGRRAPTGRAPAAARAGRSR